MIGSGLVICGEIGVEEFSELGDGEFWPNGFYVVRGGNKCEATVGGCDEVDEGIGRGEGGLDIFPLDRSKEVLVAWDLADFGDRFF